MTRGGATRRLCLFLVFAALASPSIAAQGFAAPADGAPPNILLLIADDLGVDMVGAYHEHPDPAKTPVIDSLASQGLLFRNAYTDPSCCPSRAAMITGRDCRRTGFGFGTNWYKEGTELPLSEVCIPEALPPAYHSFAIGKWHLGSLKLSGPLHPNLQGFEHFRGSAAILPDFIGDAYYDWEKITDGVYSECTTYATTESVDDALELIQSAGSDPWFVWLAFHAPHAPFHKPPPNLHTYNLPLDIASHIPIHVKATTEAMDTEIGRLLTTLGPAVLANTYVIFVGDNGTASLATTAPFDPNKAKNTVYEGGINVPLIVKGPGVATGECAALVNSTDLFATIMQLTGSSANADDSVSLVPYFSQPGLPSLRNSVYVELFQPNGFGAYSSRQRAVRGPKYKLMYGYTLSNLPTLQHFFDLQADPWEQQDLLAGTLTSQQQAAYADLAAQLAEPYIAWQPLADPVPGSNGAPVLTGLGQSLVANAPIALVVTKAKPGAPLMLVVGGANIGLYFKGGVLVPRPDFLYFYSVPGNGTLLLQSHWPAGMPAGFPILFQAWIQDAAAVYGWAGTNGLAATGP
jgi:arylsulfatase A-like enzyme